MSEEFKFHTERKRKVKSIIHETLHVWIGGLCINNLSTWAFAYSDNEKKNTFLSGISNESDIDRLHLNVILEFLEWIDFNVKKDIMIYTNNIYIVNIFREWIDKWVKTDFKTIDNNDRPNSDLLRKIHSICKSENIDMKIGNYFTKNGFTEKINELCRSECINIS